MDEHPLDFAGSVHRSGYRWRETIQALPPAKTDAEPYLEAVKTSGKRRIYRPLKERTGLFRTFAETPPTQEGILRFANRYGLLGGDIQVLVEPETSEGYLGAGESFRDWVKEMTAMSDAVELWQLLEQNNCTELQNRIRWVGPSDVRYEDKRGGVAVIANDLIRPERLGDLVFGDLIRPARYYIQQLINKNIRGRVSPQMLWDENFTKQSQYLVPDSLCGALWLQFLHAYAGNGVFQRCLHCDEWFEIAPPITRSTRIYCSNTCKVTAYRNRKTGNN